MTMPGFVFHFRCECGAISSEYSVYAFPATFEPYLSLPTWSPHHSFWGSFSAELTENKRHELESDKKRLQDFAASISCEKMTVGVPQMVSGRVEVTPRPRCPQCGEMCESVFGYPPNSGKPTIDAEMLKEFDAIPISLVELSVRARMICSEIGIDTLGDLDDFQAKIAEHPRITQNIIREIDDVLALKPLTAAEKNSPNQNDG
jgi:hypothetical protein